MTEDIHTIRFGGLTATIKAQGAELCSLKNAAGTEFICQAGPAWPRHRGKTDKPARLCARQLFGLGGGR